MFDEVEGKSCECQLERRCMHCSLHTDGDCVVSTCSHWVAAGDIIGFICGILLIVCGILMLVGKKKRKAAPETTVQAVLDEVLFHSTLSGTKLRRVHSSADIATVITVWRGKGRARIASLEAPVPHFQHFDTAAARVALVSSDGQQRVTVSDLLRRRRPQPGNAGHVIPHLAVNAVIPAVTQVRSDRAHDTAFRRALLVSEFSHYLEDVPGGGRGFLAAADADDRRLPRNQIVLPQLLGNPDIGFVEPQDAVEQLRAQRRMCVSLRTLVSPAGGARKQPDALQRRHKRSATSGLAEIEEHALGSSMPLRGVQVVSPLSSTGGAIPQRAQARVQSAQRAAASQRTAAVSPAARRPRAGSGGVGRVARLAASSDAALQVHDRRGPPVLLVALSTATDEQLQEDSQATAVDGATTCVPGAAAAAGTGADGSTGDYSPPLPYIAAAAAADALSGAHAAPVSPPSVAVVVAAAAPGVEAMAGTEAAMLPRLAETQPVQADHPQVDGQPAMPPSIVMPLPIFQYFDCDRALVSAMLRRDAQFTKYPPTKRVELPLAAPQSAPQSSLPKQQQPQAVTSTTSSIPAADAAALAPPSATAGAGAASTVVVVPSTEQCGVATA